MLSLNDRGKNHTARALLEKVTPELLSYKAWHSLESNFEAKRRAQKQDKSRHFFQWFKYVKKYKALISKQVPCILKYMPCIFCKMPYVSQAPVQALSATP